MGLTGLKCGWQGLNVAAGRMSHRISEQIPDGPHWATCVESGAHFSLSSLSERRGGVGRILMVGATVKIAGCPQDPARDVLIVGLCCYNPPRFRLLQSYSYF